MKKQLIIIIIIISLANLVYSDATNLDKFSKESNPQKNPFTYTLPSMIIPGSGLLLQNNMRGLLYMTIEAALGIAFYFTHDKHISSYSNYLATGSTNSYNDASNTLVLVSLIGTSIISIWLLNIFDTIFETIKFNNSLESYNK